MSNKKIDLTGQRFGRLVVKEEIRKRGKRGHRYWKCQCDCGNYHITREDDLKKEATKSCGCLKKEKFIKRVTTHGQSNTRIYKIWENMFNRCYNPNHKNYKDYGGKGIKVCERWQKFENFYEDMKNELVGELTIDRIDNYDNYTPSNCKGSTVKEQNQNTRAKGYCWSKERQKWQAYINVDYKRISLGYFNCPEDARKAYVEAKKKYHGIYLDE